MGNFYTNIALLGPSRDEVLARLREERRRAYVAPAHRGGTVVYDAECEFLDAERLEALTGRLAASFGCPALAARVHDDDVLSLALYDAVGFVLRYDSSAPSCSARRLRDAWRTSAPVAWLWAVLRWPHALLLFGSLRHGHARARARASRLGRRDRLRVHRRRRAPGEPVARRPAPHAARGRAAASARERRAPAAK